MENKTARGHVLGREDTCTGCGLISAYTGEITCPAVRNPYTPKHVWGGRLHLKGGGQKRALVAADTKVEARRILEATGHRISTSEFRNYWCETNNMWELAAGREKGAWYWPDDRERSYGPTRLYAKNGVFGQMADVGGGCR